MEEEAEDEGTCPSNQEEEALIRELAANASNTDSTMKLFSIKKNFQSEFDQELSQ